MAHSQDGTYGSIGGAGNELEVDGEGSETDGLLSSPSIKKYDKKIFCQIGVAVIVVILFVSLRPGHTSPKSSFKYRPSYSPDGKREPETPRYYMDQIVDHNNPETSSTYRQKYFANPDFHGGPGHPIFVIMGGEDVINYILYPFVSETLAKKHSAYTMCIEHRFYGNSLPVPIDEISNNDLRNLLTPAQALADAVRLIKHKQEELGCGPRFSPDYCPVMTVGGSYPGFLSALMRIVHDDVVDMGYASSSVMDLYDHRTPQFAYFEKITQVAEKASPGCADSVRSALDKVNSYVRDAAAETDDDSMTIDSLAEKLGICVETIPEYINTHALLAQELGMIIASHFAENNMDYYPPSEDQVMVQGCKIFQDPNLSASEKVSSFLRMQKRFEVCYAMTADLPPGPKGTISAADWSGVGEGQAGWMWDFQTCVLAPACGMSEKSMFIPRKWSMEWLTEHCERRFGVTPELDRMVTQFHFDKLENVTRLLLTNGGNDGWSVASIPEDLPANIEVIVFPNGSHHSDLTHFGPIKADTPDIKDGHARIGDLVGGWLDQVLAENGKE